MSNTAYIVTEKESRFIVVDIINDITVASVEAQPIDLKDQDDLKAENKRLREALFKIESLNSGHDHHGFYFTESGNIANKALNPINPLPQPPKQ